MAFTEPTAVPNSGNPATYNSDMDYFAGWWANFAAELNAVGYPDLPVEFRIDGTSTLPAQRWAADPNTGMYRPGADQIAWATGGVKRLHISNTGIEATVPITGAAVQSGPLDDVTGRLLRVGAFGLGGVAPAIANASVTDNSIAPGTYGYFNSSTGGPSGVTAGILIHTRRAAGGGEGQILIADAPAFGIYARSRTSANWSAWMRLDPHRGSNANGEWIRFGDGTQICRHVLNNVPDPGTASFGWYVSNEVVWNFPAEFIAAPGVDASVRFAGGLDAKARPNGLSSASISLLSGAALTGSRVVDVRAEGRWF